MVIYVTLEPMRLAQCCKLCAVLGYKRLNSGTLLAHVRSFYLNANGVSIETYPSGLVPDYEHYIEQQLITVFDLKADGPAGRRVRGSVDIQLDALTCTETALM